MPRTPTEPLISISSQGQGVKLALPESVPGPAVAGVNPRILTHFCSLLPNQPSSGRVARPSCSLSVVPVGDCAVHRPFLPKVELCPE